MKQFRVFSIVAAAVVCAWAPAAAHAQTAATATATATATAGATSGSATTATTTASPAATTTVTATGDSESAYTARLQARYPTIASQSNLESVVHGLRTGSAITLTGTTATPGTTTATTTFTPPTRPMGYGNITRAMTLATRQLSAAGITDPTPQQLHAALMGGPVTTPTGSVEMKGVLQLRSAGMGWGNIAHSIGVAPGMGSATTAAASGANASASTARTGITTAGGGAVGVTTGTKTPGRGHAAEVRGRGIVTAAGTGISAGQYRNGNGHVAGASLAANVSAGRGLVNGAGPGAAGLKAHGGKH